MVASGKEGALSDPFSPLHVLCIVLGGWCLTGGSPRPVGALEASVVAQGVTAWSGCGEQEWSPSLDCLPNWLLQNCFGLCSVLCTSVSGMGNKSLLQRMLLLDPALEQRPPGAGTRDSGAARGSGDISTGLLWLLLNCSKIHSRNTVGGGREYFLLLFFFLKCKVKCPCSTVCLRQILGKLVQPAPVWAGRALPVLGALPGSTGV